MFIMRFLFLLLHIRLIPGDMIFYILFQDAFQSPVDAQVYVLLWGSPGLLQKGIRQF